MHVKELLSLKKKVILITGGEGLYGSSITEALAEADGTVITASPFLDNATRFVDGLNAKGLTNVYAKYVDQADHDSIIKLKADIVKDFGGIDVFINNAVARPMKKYRDPLENYAESMRINAVGMFDIAREIADLIAERGGGTIVNIASMQGVFGADFKLYEGTDYDSPPDYHFHKGGMIALTKYLARKLAPQKVRVNCLSPGGLYTGQIEPFVHLFQKWNN
jgi:NAD(P)-dependent dehydrogenase (short-subunit alcohol dehydrogenase family)